MTNLSKNFASSPFDSIRHEGDRGEYWIARELMPLLQYQQWRRFEETIGRAKLSCEIAGFSVGGHFIHLPGSASGSGRFGDDYKLTRYACHLVAMNGDVRKEAIAQAQAYFSIKTHEAETIIPAQNDRIKELELQRDIAQAHAAAAQANAATTSNQLRVVERTESLVTMHGVPNALALLGRSNEIIELEKPTLEVIDEKHKAHFKGQTLKQVAQFIGKRYGIKLKDGGSVKKILERAEKDNLIAHVPRAVVSEYIPAEHLQEVYKLLTDGDRQMLLGE